MIVADESVVVAPWPAGALARAVLALVAVLD